MPDSSAIPPASLSLHGPLIEQNLPAWITDATPSRRAALKEADAPVPDWYRQATAAQRKVLSDAAVDSFVAQTALDQAVAPLKDIDTFAEPLLVAALKAQFNVQSDVHKTLLCLRKPVDVGVFHIQISSFEVLRLPLLQAALHNFEEAESEEGAFHASSGFLGETASGKEDVVSPGLTVAQFVGLCRSLDIGALYQRYLNTFFYPPEIPPQQLPLRHTFIDAQKKALAAAAQLALLKKDIGPDDHAMILSVINGNHQPSLGGRAVWFRDLGLMKHRMTGCVVFVICEKYRYTDDLILYIPNDPFAPLKRHTRASMDALFKQRFSAGDAQVSAGDGPTGYRLFFSRFVAYADRPDYFDQLTDDDPSTPAIRPGSPFVSLLNQLVNGINPFSAFTSINEIPPGPPARKVPNSDPYLNPVALTRRGAGLWSENINLWDYLFDRYREQALADARSHAVPTADVDARVRSEKFAHLLDIGMLVLNTVSMLVPVLGEVMMGVMASQLLYESFEGAVEWAEGDRKAAKAHLIDVADNIVQLAIMAGVGKGFAKLVAVKPVPVIEALEPVVSADGKTRLWKAALEPYESPVALRAGVRPNELGQYQQDGKTYIRQAGKVYEVTQDAPGQRWRIKHPADDGAYQPLLDHNGAGAWRHVLERPLEWDRLSLLRRLGPAAESFNDEQLLSIADISGVSDNALRKIHMDNAPLPAALSDTLRMFEADRDVARLIEQVQSGQAQDERTLFILPLVTEMPRWPQGRMLEVFDAQTTIKYGPRPQVPRSLRKPVIRVSRADVLDGHLSARILAALDEDEITRMMGDEPARVRDERPRELNKQIAEYARTRQPALFESLYQGNGPKNPLASKLQRLYPGLGQVAAQEALATAGAEQVARFRQTGRVPLSLQQHIRWLLRQGRVRHAYAGLHMENLASGASRRLALHTLAALPGWPEGLRLEVREGSIEGPLLDAVGPQGSATGKYLVKKGPGFQAFNERGEALNSLARHGDNFYASIMHALPDESRQSLGVPQVSQSALLRRLIIDHATGHPLQSQSIVESGQPRPRRFKPPQRVSRTQLGYPASGRGEGMLPSLSSRVRAVYPQLSEGQANGFILRRMLAGDSERQIFNLLNNRQREWQTLQTTLNQWVVQDTTRYRYAAMAEMGGRQQAARALMDSWRNAPLAELPERAQLRLISHTPLPALEADFSHVRTLTIGGDGFTGESLARTLRRFSGVETLTVVVNHPNLRNAPEALSELPGLTHLTIMSGFSLEAPQVARLESLSQLQGLNLDCMFESGHVLDVSRMQQLRSLTLSRNFQPTFPVGVLDLAQLERLNLRGTGVRTLPARMFEPGHERLWRGLSLDWSQFEPGEFRRAYEYVNRHPEHLVDPEEMVRGYCQGELLRMLSPSGVAGNLTLRSEQSSALLGAFLQRWSGASARFEAIEALSSQYQRFMQPLQTWGVNREPRGEFMQRYNVVSRLQGCWYDGLYQHYGLTGGASALDLSSLQLSELPPLPEEGFEHIRELNLRGLRAPEQQLGGFINHFRSLQTLNLSGCSLAALPAAEGAWATLEHLDLSHNPLRNLDVRAMPRLQALSLRHSTLALWPVGVENLADLNWLDLRDSAITHVPEGVLAHDTFVLSANWQGTPLDETTTTALAAAERRVEQARGLPAGALERFAWEEVPEQFPPAETGLTIARHLLPFSEPMGALTQRLNGWLFMREVRGTQWAVSSQSRGQAASRIAECWRERLRTPRVGETTLSLEGLQLGDLPELGMRFDHVTTLNLAGVRLSEDGSNGFLRAFSQVRALNLNGNLLTEIPEGVMAMGRLERLELAGNLFSDAQTLLPSLQRLTQLQRLDLSQNRLRTFSLNRLVQLRWLDLSSNSLQAWPEGALESPRLQTLDLSNNAIETIPASALDGRHDALMAGVDLSDNLELSRDSLEQLQEYALAGRRDPVLGMRRYDIDAALEASDSDDEINAVQPDEPLPAPAPAGEQSAPWLEGLPAEQLDPHRELWAQLEGEPDSGAFFHLLSRLPDTDEYRLSRAYLTGRVWQVVRAASEDAELRQVLFAMSITHDTCIDGRMLTFSNLEVRVFEHEALQAIDPARLDQKGAALLRLSRRMFRLERVEALADREARSGGDAAEIRLKYRIGLRQVLDLPGQPNYMRYDKPIHGQALNNALASVQQAEASDAFYEFLIQQEHWTRYLRERYPQAFADLEQRRVQQHETIEGTEYPTSQDYAEALNMLDINHQTEQNQLLITLSRRETGEAAPRSHDTEQPGPSRGRT